MTVTFEPLSVPAVNAVLTRLRAADIDELAAMGVHPDAAYAERLAAMEGFVAAQNGNPVAVCVFVNLWPGVWSAGALATDEMRPKTVGHIVRRLRAVQLPALRARGARRVHAHPLPTHAASRRTLERVGFTLEAVLRAWGADGRDFLQFVWIGEDHA